MSVKYLVFENSTQKLNMDKIPVFKSGSEMPWSYYTSNIEDDGTDENEARNRFMFTSESKPSAANAGDAGKHVTQIKRWVRTGLKTGAKFQYRYEKIDNPKLSDYKNWGWKLSKDADGNELLPNYGEFQFIPGQEPNYEDISNITVKFRFGFGLGTTAYNFAEETANVQVYNLSNEPKLYSSQNGNIDIKYDAAIGGFTGLKEESNNIINVDMKEGSNQFSYIYISVEAGEQLDLSFPADVTATPQPGEVEFELFKNGSKQWHLDSSGSEAEDLSSAYKSDIEGAPTAAQLSLQSIKFDFYKIKLRVNSDYTNMAYNKSNNLSAYITVTPKNQWETLTNFARTVKVNVSLEKDLTPPRLENSFYYDAATKNMLQHPVSTDANKRQRIIVSSNEAIHYAKKMNDASAPSFVRNNTEADALDAYKKSMLTATELSLDAYKKSFNTLAMRESLALFAAQDLSAIASANLNTWDKTSASDSSTCDLSDILKDTDLLALNVAIDAQLKGATPPVPVTVANIKANNVCAAAFDTLMKKLFTSGIDSINANSADSNSYDNSASMPWMDTNIDKQRKLGNVQDASCNDLESGARNTLLGHQSTLLALLYGLDKFEKNGSDALINNYASAVNVSQVTDGSPKLVKLVNAMKLEYHNKKASDIVDHSGVSLDRPEGNYKELMDYRYKLNPTDGISAFNYLCHMLEINHVKGADKVYYGTNELYDAVGSTRKTPTKADVEALLYGKLGSTIKTVLVGNTKLINTSDSNIGSNIDLGNFLENAPSGSGNTVFYISADASVGFLSDYKGEDKHNFNASRDATVADISNADLLGKFVYNVDGVLGVYNEANFHPENQDFSGVMKIPHSADGKYTDVFINGVEIKETIVDPEDSLENDLAVDVSALRAYTIVPQAVKDSRKTLIKDLTQKLDIYDSGIYQVYRLGNTLHWVANVADLDAEQSPAMLLPTITLQYRHDIAKEFTNVYSENYLALKDIQSELELAFNSTRDTKQGYTIFNDASGIVVASRWGNTYVPLDISGGLERGEEFYFEIAKDEFGTHENTPSFGDDASANNNDGNYTVAESLSSEKADLKFALQYLNVKEIGAEWTNVTSETRFSYEAYDTISSLANTARNTHGNHSDNTPFDKTNNSNVKGAPKFRICLPAQNQLLQEYRDSLTGAPTTFNFGSLKRNLVLNLKYSKSAKIQLLDGNCVKDVDGNNKTITLKVYVESDAYAPNMKFQQINYTQKHTGLVTSIADASDISLDYQTSGGDLSGVGYDVTVAATGAEYERIPDKTKLVSRSFVFSDYSGRLNSDTGNTVSFETANIDENRFGSQAPIAILSIDSYATTLGDSASAKIVPLFQRVQDEKDWEINNSLYCRAINDHLPGDASTDAPRLIPANDNYNVVVTDNGSKISLYRKTPLNYENWVSSSTYANGQGFAVNNGATPELVTVKITYYEPSSVAGQRGLKKEKTVAIFVTPVDIREIVWAKQFDFTVSDNEKEVDITSILSAKVDGLSAGIEYKVRGFIDESGTTHYYSALGDLSNNPNELAMDASNLQQMTATSSTLKVGLTHSTSVYVASSNDIASSSTSGLDLNNLLVNGKLKLYPSDMTNGFDAWTMNSYKILVEAYLNKNGQEDTERALALVSINVQQGTTEFKLKTGEKSYVERTETLGTIAEGRTAEQNNEKVAIKEFLDRIEHANIGDLYNPSDNSGASKSVSFKIISMDSALEVVPTTPLADVSAQEIRLKDTEANKSTESPTSASQGPADYVHYNYERQSSYQVLIQVCASKFQEIKVQKVADDHVMRFGTNATAAEKVTTTAADKTALYITKSTENDFNLEGGNDQLYYFELDGKFHGPLSVQPTKLSELSARRTVNGKQLLDAYLRHHDSGNGYTPLYKAKGFAITNKAPAPEDCATFPFFIKVKDSNDKPKVCIQPYKLNKKSEYYSAQPKAETQLDNALVEVEAGDRHVFNVFTEHIDFGANETHDVGSNYDTPVWHPDYNSVDVSLNGVTSYENLIHPDMSIDMSNGSWNHGLRNGTSDGRMNGSGRYGLYPSESNKDRVIVDYFVESHGSIDASGRNEISRERLLNKPQVFGEPIDYSGSLPMERKENGVDVEIDGTDRRMYRLSKMNKARMSHDAISQTNAFRYSTAELQFNDAHIAKVGDVYSFSIAAVSNVLATKNDMSLNKSMIDWEQRFYPKIKQSYDGADVSTNAIYPQQFQKYVYDKDGERIVTLAHAHQYNSNGVNGNAIAQHGATQNAPDYGVLVVCRTHFKVCVNAKGTTVQSTNAAGQSAVASGLNFDSSSIINASSNGDRIYPRQIVNGLNGDIKLFNVNGDIRMAVYKDGAWEQL